MNPDVTTRVDLVQDILDLAVEVLRDHGAEPRGTPVERLARWVVFNLGVQVDQQVLGGLSRTFTDDGELAAVQAGEHVGLSGRALARPMRSEQARQLATALFMSAERADLR